MKKELVLPSRKDRIILSQKKKKRMFLRPPHIIQRFYHHTKKQQLPNLQVHVDLEHLKQS
jgi:hypothetical protein